MPSGPIFWFFRLQQVSSGKKEQFYHLVIEHSYNGPFVDDEPTNIYKLWFSIAMLDYRRVVEFLRIEIQVPTAQLVWLARSDGDSRASFGFNQTTVHRLGGTRPVTHQPHSSAFD